MDISEIPGNWDAMMLPGGLLGSYPGADERIHPHTFFHKNGANPKNPYDLVELIQG